MQAAGDWWKLGCATLVLEGLWELVAQLVEQRTFNAWVSGSIPDELTTRWPPTLLKTTSNCLLKIAVSGLSERKPLAMFLAQESL